MYNRITLGSGVAMDTRGGPGREMGWGVQREEVTPALYLGFTSRKAHSFPAITCFEVVSTER